MEFIEWCYPILGKLAFYTVEVNGSRLFILDAHLGIIKHGPDACVQDYGLGVYKSKNKHPPYYGNVLRARLHLKISNFVHVVWQAYTEVEFPRCLTLGVTPFRFNLEICSSNEFSLLLNWFSKCTCLHAQNVGWQCLFKILQQRQIHTKFELNGILPLNHMTFVCFWKGVVACEPENISYLNFYKSIDGCERDVILLLTMARNRSKGNIFAQFNKNVFLHILIPLIKWSMPL